MKPGKTGIRRIINASAYSWQGFKAAFKHEAAFRQELILCLVLLALLPWVASNKLEVLILILSLFIVLICEIINSAIEAVVDRFGDEIHPLAGRAKDMGSAAVFLALLNLGVCWSLIFYTNYSL
jgi:diacylglycerol kinase (ATP)